MLLNAIIFSKDRPMQLHLLLESILLNFDVEDYKLNILYKASNDEYNRGYNMIRDLYPQFTYKKEESFKEDLLSLFNESKYTIFLTDDDIIYQSFKLNNDELHNIFMLTNANCFSLRLGLNTVDCYTQQRLNKLNKYNTHNFYYDIDLIEPVISWKVGDSTNDYAYPMSVDGHIFNTVYIKNLCEVLEYSNPNLFEAMLSNFGTSEMIISSYKSSKLVKNIIKNHINEDLNEMYLDGIVVNLNKLNFTEINGPSQEIKPIFKVSNEIIDKVPN
jgi:hypothetical protein